MEQPEPRKPENLHPLAVAILEELSKGEGTSSIILGGGVALQHYCNARETQDVDAWWKGFPDQKARKSIERAMEAVSRETGLKLSKREWSETVSYELSDDENKVFSFQIAVRDRQLDAELESFWPPLKIESFRDNLGAKMNALVSRGAPRDFVDVFEICRRKLATESDCWEVWREKNPEKSIEQGKANALRHLKRIEARRPLSAVSEDQREGITERRAWIEKSLCEGVKDDHGLGS